MKQIMQQIKTGSYWTATNNRFLVTGIEVNRDGTWIFYENVNTKQQYSCLEGAFLNRFNLDLTGK